MAHGNRFARVSRFCGGLIYLHLDPGYTPLRGDPRFSEMVRRIGLK